MHSIPEILSDLRAGKMIVLIDDEQRENEGDLVCAAEHVTPEAVNFLLREARGVLCLALSGEYCDRLGLGPQAAVNTAQHGTAFMVTIDAAARFGVTTGVSASDRATTIRVAVDEKTVREDLSRPGHINPLRAREGGALVRAGQTEGSVDLCRLAGLKPAAVIIEVMNEDGSMARLGDLQQMCGKHGLKMCSVAEIIEYRLRREKLVERVETVAFDSEYGRFSLIAYRSKVDPLPHVALVCGGVGRLDEHGESIPIEEPVLVRMHSQDLLGDVFGDRGAPSGRVLHAAMKMIQREGRGAVVYLQHETMGASLFRRMRGLQRSVGEGGRGVEREMEVHEGVSGARLLGAKQDYGIGSQILRDLGVHKLRLLTNHPVQPTALEGFGLSITEFVKVEG
jgi:3,4-dihydroxy 2-butanone 4-phosphate synthase/GTP cyclohydrolase II